MARPKSEDKRIALLEAAIRVFVAHGLSAPTALIAKEAGVANGTLFTYFDTKAELLQQLYLELKSEMATASLRGLPTGKEFKIVFLHVWSNWMHWAAAHPEKPRTLALLAVSEDITPEIRSQAGHFMEEITELLEQCRAQGPLRDVPMAFVGEIMTSLANATMAFMINDPEHAADHCKT
ncbi:TetR/AcrR family transcriptional regulator, partial [bacterium]